MFTQLELTTEEQLRNLKQNDRIVLRHSSGRDYFMLFKRIENNTLVTKETHNAVQEIFIDIPTIVHIGLDNYFNQIVQLA